MNFNVSNYMRLFVLSLKKNHIQCDSMWKNMTSVQNVYFPVLYVCV